MWHYYRHVTVHYITCYLADAFLQCDIQLIRRSRRHTPWSTVGLRALLKGPTTVPISYRGDRTADLAGPSHVPWPLQAAHKPCQVMLSLRWYLIRMIVLYNLPLHDVLGELTLAWCHKWFWVSWRGRRRCRPMTGWWCFQSRLIGDVSPPQGGILIKRWWGTKEKKTQGTQEESEKREGEETTQEGTQKEGEALLLVRRLPWQRLTAERCDRSLLTSPEMSLLCLLSEQTLAGITCEMGVHITMVVWFDVQFVWDVFCLIGSYLQMPVLVSLKMPNACYF